MNKVWLIQAITFTLIGLAIILLIIKIYHTIELERRIARYSLKMDQSEELSYFDKLYCKYQQFLHKFQKNPTLIKYSTKYEKHSYLENSINAVSFIINKLVIALSFVLLILVSSTLRGKIVNFSSFLFSFIIGYYLYDIYLVIHQKRRKKKIKNDMLRAVIIMNNAFKAGKSTLQAVEIASHDLPEPIAKEFRKIAQDMAYGLSVDIAFNRFAKRVDIEEAKYISSSLTILSKTGGNIIMVFSSIERTLFDKKKLESDLKNSTAASNLVVKVLMVIPILFVLVIYFISPDYFEPLFQSTLGYLMISIIILMFSIYLYLLNKIMKVKV